MKRLAALLAVTAGGYARAQDAAGPATTEATIAAAPEAAPAWSSKGEVALESRLFRGDGDPTTVDRAAGLFARLEVQHQRGFFEGRARGFGRLDYLDAARSMLVFEEAFAQVQSKRFRLRAGADTVNWTATEAFHPADVINARNLDSDLENFEKLGEPMVSLQARLAAGTTATAYYLPYRTSPIFTSSRSRLHFAPAGVELRGRRLMSDRKGHLTDAAFGHQAAVNIRQTVGHADFSLHLVEHMDRAQPQVLVDLATGELRLLFQTVRQVGGTYQHALGPVLAKLEGAYRHFIAVDDTLPSPFGYRRDRDHGTVAAGIEYGLAHDGGAESTFIAEAQVVLGGDADTRATLTPFQRDALAGYRLALNDESSRQLLIGIVVDLESANEYLVNASYEQRLGDTWTVRAGVRVFQAKQRAVPTGLSALRNADHVRLTLARHF